MSIDEIGRLLMGYVTTCHEQAVAPDANVVKAVALLSGIESSALAGIARQPLEKQENAPMRDLNNWLTDERVTNEMVDRLADGLRGAATREDAGAEAHDVAPVLNTPSDPKAAAGIARQSLEPSPNELAAAVEAARRLGWAQDDITLAAWIAQLAAAGIAPPSLYEIHEDNTRPNGAAELEQGAGSRPLTRVIFDTVTGAVTVEPRERCSARTDVFGRCDLQADHDGRHMNACGDSFSVC